EVREMIRGHAMVHHLTDLSDLAHEEHSIQVAVARLLQREPQMAYAFAFEQACPERAREKQDVWYEQKRQEFADTREHPAEPLSPEDRSSEAPDSDEAYEQEERHEETQGDPASSSQGPSAVHKPASQADY